MEMVDYAVIVSEELGLTLLVNSVVCVVCNVLIVVDMVFYAVVVSEELG